MRTDRACIFPSTFSALFMDGSLNLNFLSTFLAVFVDGSLFLNLSSMISGFFMDGRHFNVLLFWSTKRFC